MSDDDARAQIFARVRGALARVRDKQALPD